MKNKEKITDEASILAYENGPKPSRYPEYLNDEELEQLIDQTEQGPLLQAPSYLKREVLEKIQKKEDIRHRNAMRLKNWQIITIVAAALLFLMVMPMQIQPRSVGLPERNPVLSGLTLRNSGNSGEKEDVSGYGQEEKAAQSGSQDAVGSWMYARNREVGTAIRNMTDRLVPNFSGTVKNLERIRK